MTADPAALAEIDTILAPVKAAHPGITNAEVVDLLPERLRGPFWERAVERYVEAELARLDAEGGKPA